VSRISSTLGEFGPSGACSSQAIVRSSSSATGSSRRISDGLALWMRTSGKPSACALRNWVTVNSYSSSSVMSRSRRRPMSRLQPNEVGTNPCRSKASRQSRTNSGATSG
jgi:hypothetical protein